MNYIILLISTIITLSLLFIWRTKRIDDLKWYKSFSFIFFIIGFVITTNIAFDLFGEIVLVVIFAIISLLYFIRNLIRIFH